jgi:hypothetical protein
MERSPIGFRHRGYRDEYSAFHESQTVRFTRYYSDMEIPKNKKSASTYSNKFFSGTVCIR